MRIDLSVRCVIAYWTLPQVSTRLVSVVPANSIELCFVVSCMDCVVVPANSIKLFLMLSCTNCVDSPTCDDDDDDDIFFAKSSCMACWLL